MHAAGACAGRPAGRGFQAPAQRSELQQVQQIETVALCRSNKCHSNLHICAIQFQLGRDTRPLAFYATGEVCAYGEAMELSCSTPFAEARDAECNWQSWLTFPIKVRKQSHFKKQLHLHIGTLKGNVLLNQRN